MALQKTNFTFEVGLESEPEQKMKLEAHLFYKDGNHIDSQPIKDGKFSLSIPDGQLIGKRLFIAPVNDKVKRERKITLNDVMGSQVYEPELPSKIDVDKTITLYPVPNAIINWWHICLCRVRGTVYNYCNGHYEPVYHARIHICEVDPIIIWLRKLPDYEILNLKDLILQKRLIKQPIIPKPPIGPDPPPEFTVETGILKTVENMAKFNHLKTVENTDFVKSSQITPKVSEETENVRLTTEMLPKSNIALLYSDSAALVRNYFIENYKLLYPWFCFYWRPWWRYWYRCDELKTVYTDANGNFDTTIWYFCSGDHPDIYIWVEYCINGVWKTVYKPYYFCSTRWNYVCGSQINIYLSDQRIPCPANPTIPGKVVVVTTLGNRANVNRVQQSGTNQGLAPDLSYRFGNGMQYNGYGPFGGSVEPHVLFGDGLIPSGVKYYRWSFKAHGDSASPWEHLNSNVDRHCFRINADNSTSFPTYNLGPKTTPNNTDLFEIQKQRNPVTDEPWYILDARTDTATAYFRTKSLQNGNVADAAGLYDLKLEFFDTNGKQVNLANLGISLQVPDSSYPAPFGNVEVPNVTAPPENQLLDVNNKLLGFKMIIKVDNNNTNALINEVTVDMASGTENAGPCGMIKYHQNNDIAHIDFKSYHPNDYAYFRFNIYKGSSGIVHQVCGEVDNTPPVTVWDLDPPAVAENYIYDSVNNRFSSSKKVSTLLGECDDAAFSEVLIVWATATDGWTRLEYDSSDVKAFALYK